MSAKLFAEAARCVNAFAPVQSTGARLQVEAMAIKRDFAELDQKLAEALSQGNAVGPVLQEICELSLENARVLEEWSANAAQSAALCLQSAEVFKKLSR